MAPGWVCLCHPNQDANLLDWPGRMSASAPGRLAVSLWSLWTRVDNPVSWVTASLNSAEMCQGLLAGPVSGVREVLRDQRPARTQQCAPPAQWGQPWGAPSAAWVVGEGGSAGGHQPPAAPSGSVSLVPGGGCTGDGPRRAAGRACGGSELFNDIFKPKPQCCLQPFLSHFLLEDCSGKACGLWAAPSPVLGDPGPSIPGIAGV